MLLVVICGIVLDRKDLFQTWHNQGFESQVCARKKLPAIVTLRVEYFLWMLMHYGDQFSDPLGCSDQWFHSVKLDCIKFSPCVPGRQCSGEG